MVAPTRSDDHAAPTQLALLRQRAEQLRAAVQMTEYELSGCRQHIDELLGSTSWRITAPLRRLRERLAGIGKGHARTGPPKYAVRAPQASSLRPTEGAVAPSASSRAADAAAGGAFSGVRELHVVALTEHSLEARDLIARAATGAACNYRDLQERFSSQGAHAVACCTDPVATWMLARVAANQAEAPADEALALALFRRHREWASGSDWELADHVTYVELLRANGESEAASRHLEDSGLRDTSPMDYHCLRANGLLQGDGGESATWLEAINVLFVDAGIEPVGLAEGGAQPLDRLTCTVPACTIEDMPLVSVLMTTFQPDSATDTAIASVLNQSWRNLELIIVDDASPDESFCQLARWGERDNRVRILRAERNGGTYAAKNLGLAQARGEFVTCHDSDDWSHPRKLEVQARHLLENRGAVGNLNCLARVSPALAFLRFSLQGKLVYLNTSSLMFRRKQVVEQIGFWDTVRYGADTEYYKRMELVFGQKLPVLDIAPLSFGRTHDRSLTSGTLGRGFISFERRWYQSAWMAWHRSIRRKTTQSRLPLDAPRPFPVPFALRPASATNDIGVDAVLVADYCLPDGHAKAFAREIETRLDKGQRLAICQVRSLHTGAVARRFANERIQRLVNDRGVTVVKLDDLVACEELVVLYPRVLEFTAHQTSRVKPARVSVVDTALSSEDRPLDWQACRAEMKRLFGQDDSPVAVAKQDKAPKVSANAYWKQRKNDLYYIVARTLVEKLLGEGQSLIDVGSNRCPYLDWFPKVSHRTSIDLRHPYEAPGVRSITGDFLRWEPDADYDVAMCLQVLEHVPDAGAFARKLLDIARVLVVSVPYKWEPGRVKGHIHDPVDEEKLRGWFGREPNFQYLCREVVSGRERLVQVYERGSAIPWTSLNERKAARQ